jgi:hypothetical protein
MLPTGQFVTFDNESWIGDNPRIGDRHLQGDQDGGSSRATAG